MTFIFLFEARNASFGEDVNFTEEKVKVFRIFPQLSEYHKK